MGRMNWVVGGLMLGLLVGQMTARGGVLVPLSRTSSVYAEGFEVTAGNPSGTLVTKSDAMTGLGLWESTATPDVFMPPTAYQKSEILVNGVEVRLDATTNTAATEMGYGAADSRVESELDLVEAAECRFAWTLTINDPAPHGQRQAYALVKMSNTGGYIQWKLDESGTTDVPIVIAPGRYTLVMQTYAKSAWAVSASLSGGVTAKPVPEPAGMLAMGIGVVLLARRFRR